MASFGERASIYVARHEGRAVAAILTLRHKSSLVYKYGCSDATFNRYSGTPFLFWKVIQDAKARGLSELDLGRSDVVNPGLVAFKDHLGGTKTTLDYYRYPGPPLGDAHESRARAMAKRLYMKVPSPLRRHVDGTLYRHFA
jgi:lipid II:glycine glycyltransferase (peptidoglycan interpeptide bridge formation enzyme)